MNDKINFGDDKFLLNSSIMNSEKKWRIVNDGVMGGLSSSEATVNDKDKIIFTGNISLENNGGFTSLRSQINNFNFENFSGIEININGGGKNFSISMKETAEFTGYYYTAQFATNVDDYSLINIPFDQFKLKYFGKEISSQNKIPLNKIKQVSILIGDEQSGNFIAEIDYVKLY